MDKEEIIKDFDKKFPKAQKEIRKFLIEELENIELQIENLHYEHMERMEMASMED